MQTGLNPIEHGYLGWDLYIKPINKIIAIYTGIEKGKKTQDEDFEKVQNLLNITTIPEKINKEGKYQGIEFFPFKKTLYQDLDDMLEKIKKKTKESGKKYIYAYDAEPDHTMHDFGPDSTEVKKLIIERNSKIEQLSKELENTILFVIADHGHKKVKHLFLEDYPDIIKLLVRTTSLEQRATSFKVKEGKKEEFTEKFHQYFGNYFNLYSKEEVINCKLFGDGKEHLLFKDALGDFISIAENSDKCLVTKEDPIFISHHAGYTDDEIYIPIIIIDKTC